ncbi:peroxiredoxin like 2C S homeolog isoform X1 [Xenopus laevis]|uniref:Peroxiredoxin like 2C S homeolog isoform X1 n=1 Tax=Xenopus laevis TaxID=8355 RepID=A0A8J0TMM3_XENLA|nr:peroxiredoxin like 2C S homeolog isoform X1 [Xenopus laevis]
MAAATRTPVTQQINVEEHTEEVFPAAALFHPDLELAADCLLWDRHGRSRRFGDLYRERKTIVVFVRNFLCYTCKEYVEDLAKIPSSALEDANVRLIVIGQLSYIHIEHFCSLTGYPYEMYVDTDRTIYSKLGMKKGETSTSSGNRVQFLHRDMNRLDQTPINSLLQNAGVQALHFGDRPVIVDV